MLSISSQCIRWLKYTFVCCCISCEKWLAGWPKRKRFHLNESTINNLRVSWQWEYDCPSANIFWWKFFSSDPTAVCLIVRPRALQLVSEKDRFNSQQCGGYLLHPEYFLISPYRWRFSYAFGKPRNQKQNDVWREEWKGAMKLDCHVPL